ncbi:MAG: twin transmembrane helix small protein [Pseudomonadota bacterium]
MSQVLLYLAGAACFATLGVLMVGIGGFGSGKASPKFSNRMMRWRIIAQLVAIVLIMLTVLAARNGG